MAVVLTDLGDGRTHLSFSGHGDVGDPYIAAGGGWSMFFDRFGQPAVAEGYSS